MAALAATAALGLALVAADERSLFHFPGYEDFRTQAIARTDREQEWPFSVDRGYLLCAWVLGQQAVYFAEQMTEEQREDDLDPRIVAVTTDPIEIIIGSIGSRDLFAPYRSIEELIVRLAPLVPTGRRLCDQPRGSEIGPGEL